MTPAGVREAVEAGHHVLAQKGGGAAISLTNDQYETAGATIVDATEEIFEKAE